MSNSESSDDLFVPCHANNIRHTRRPVTFKHSTPKSSTPSRSQQLSDKLINFNNWTPPPLAHLNSATDFSELSQIDLTRITKQVAFGKRNSRRIEDAIYCSKITKQKTKFQKTL